MELLDKVRGGVAAWLFGPLLEATITKVSLNPGDVLIVRVPANLHKTAYARLHRKISTEFQENKVILFNEDIDLGIIEYPAGAIAQAAIAIDGE